MSDKASKQPLPWLRLYTETVDDEKLRLLAFEDRWHYIAILCCKGKGMLDDGSDDQLVERKLAVKLGVQIRELEEIKRRLSEVGLVDQSWQPTGWDKRQYVSDSSTDRVRRHREKQRRQPSGRARIATAGQLRGPGRGYGTGT